MDKRLGDLKLELPRFSGLKDVLSEFKKPAFQKMNELEKASRVNQKLVELVLKEKPPTFLLAAVVEYISEVVKAKIVEHYSFHHFEQWLCHHSKLSKEEELKVRGYIAGKYVPRTEYQVYFPIGTGKTYPGTHYVTAHGSPDLDTTIASFWGWLDAFAAKVGDHLHLWNLPGGSPPQQVEVDLLFTEMFGKGLFEHVVKGKTSLTLTAFDLLTQRGVSRHKLSATSFVIEEEGEAILVVDDEGYFVGEWRPFDVEGVRQVTQLLNLVLRRYQQIVYTHFLSLFGSEKMATKECDALIKKLSTLRLGDADPVKEFTPQEKSRFTLYLTKILHVSPETSMSDFAAKMQKQGVKGFSIFFTALDKLKSSGLKQERAPLFRFLEEIVKLLDEAILNLRTHVEQFKNALRIKEEVLRHPETFISPRAEIEELRTKMASHAFLPVVGHAGDKRVPLGVVHAEDLSRQMLGTVSLRDFCNRDETKVPAYLDIISVIDHHKSQIATTAPAVVYITDAQSSNVLLANLAFRLNDLYSTGGMKEDEIEKQMKPLVGKRGREELLARLLRRQSVLHRKGGFFVDPRREMLEYLHFLYAAFDDTDLLTKVSPRDVICVAELLRRLKSLQSGREEDVVDLHELKRDEKFATEAAGKILQHVETFSLYRKIYAAKEAMVTENLKKCAVGEDSTIFLDTKEQNGCCRVGQTKLFQSSIATYKKLSQQIRKRFVDHAEKVWKARKEIDLHLHMISTIAGADELHKGKETRYDHLDELWIWIPKTDQAEEHLKSFLAALRQMPVMEQKELKLMLLGDNAEQFKEIFEESFPPIPSEKKAEKLSMAILQVRPGSINSRKAIISPCLPKLG